MIKYPKHFLEPIRLEIAIAQIQHDLRKLLPTLSKEDWARVDREIAQWPAGEPYELEPVHDFWNFFGSFSRSLKGKSLINWVSAENVIWQKTDVPVDQIIFTWDFPQFKFMPKAPYSTVDVKEKLDTPALALYRDKIKKDAGERSKRYPNRDYFPIVLFCDNKGGVFSPIPGYYILEGNRRTAKALIENQNTIPAYVGQFIDDKSIWPENYWPRTGLLRDLVFLAIGYEKNHQDEDFEIIRKFYQLMLRDFDIARIVTIDKTFKTFENSERLLKELLLKDLYS